MVSLAIVGDVDSRNASDDLSQTLCLQDAAIWFPDIPYSELTFLGVAEQSKSDREQSGPLQMALFSDILGADTRRPKGIRIWINGYGTIPSLRIDLDEPLHGQAHIYHGANEDTLELIRREEEEHDFTINSAGGERIIGLDVNYYFGNFYFGNFMLGFEVCYCSNQSDGRRNLN